MVDCYRPVNATEAYTAINQQRCGTGTSGAQFCCAESDTCLENSICHFTSSQVGSSGYYIGACTDPNFPEPCSKSCSNILCIDCHQYSYAHEFSTGDWPSQDIIYKESSLDLWACCRHELGGSLNCSGTFSESITSTFPCSLSLHNCKC